MQSHLYTTSVITHHGDDATEHTMQPVASLSAGIASDPGFQRLVVVLIRPTHYDDDGFPHRYWRGVLPSNSLAVMNSLTSEALARILPDGFPIEVHALEDGISLQAGELARLSLRFPEPGTKLIVGLVAVQTAEFPRACDIIDRWKARGAACVMGGFHVSGTIATMHDCIKDATRKDVPCPGVMPPEVQELMDAGVTVFYGEAEELWPPALADIIAGKPRALYRGGLPDLQHAPMPRFPAGYFSKSFVTEIGTLDTGRGCPFACSFCSIINVQGRKSRYREPAAIIAQVRETCERMGRASFFFTDDNFARNPLWEEILDGLAALRQQGHRIFIMIEADLACGKIPRFIEKLAKAGCGQIFMGVESMNPESLAGAHKYQNKVGEYRKLWQRCHDHGIAVHAGYIVGFPHDDPASVAADVEKLFEEGADQASFFMLTPIPGSEDHVRAYVAGIQMDTDLSRYDSFHAVADHPRMSREQWFAAYTSSWRQFYSVSNMIAALKRFSNREARLRLLRNYVWYRWSFATERTHPMIAGFYRFRDFRDRRPSARPLSQLRFFAQEVVRHVRYCARLIAEFYRFQQVVFEVEFAPMLAEKRGELSDRISGIGDWLRLTFGKAMTRRWLNSFWKRYAGNGWQLLLNPFAYHWHVLMVPHAVSEVVLTVRFAHLLPRLARVTMS